MFLDDKIFYKAKYKDKIKCKCDYCGDIFEKTKEMIIRSKKNNSKDTCFNKNCIKEKRKATCIENLGVENPSQNKKVKEKIKQTCIENLGVENPSQNKKIKEKIKQTCIENLGVENPSQNKKVKEKIKQTCIENLGVENPSQNKKVKEKIKQTCIENLGVENPMQNPEIQEKRKQTCIGRFGVEHPSQNKKVKEKIKQTCIENLGVEYPMQNPEVQRRRKKTCIGRFGVEHPSQNKEVQEKTRQTCINLYGKYPVNNFGKTQNEIQIWLNSFGYNFQSTYQLLNGKEIDLYEENKKIAIEYCGLYWHNELSPEPRNKNYHYEKYKICLNKGIQLITIFEDEWINREFQCKSHLKSILGVIDKKIFARKCIIKEIPVIEAKEFFNNYHIQGCNHLHIVTFGLFYEEELVGAISLGRHNRQNINRSIITLDRLCFKDGVQVIGGASKLFSQCIKWSKDRYKQILSFSDNRWSLGNVYKVLNFVLEREYGPDYSYVNIKNPLIRLSKQSQSKKASNCPVDKTEYEWTLESGLGRIWDCGKKRWLYNL